MGEEVLEQYVELVKGENWHDAFVRWSFLAYASACLGRRVYLRNGTDYEYPTIYVMFVGPPSAKKTSTAKAPVELFHPLQQNKPFIAADVMTPAAWIQELKEAEERIGTVDEHAPIYILSKEFSSILRDIGGGSPLDLLLSFFDSRAPGQIFRKRTVSSGVVEIKNPAVTVLGCTTPAGLYDSEIMRAGSTGFISRFIIVAHPRFVRGSFNRPDVSLNARLDFAKFFDELCTMRGEIMMDQGATDFARGVYEEINAAYEKKDLPTYIEEYYGRKLTQVYKVGMIFACMRKSRVINRQDLEQAYDIITKTEENFSYMFTKRVSYQDEAILARINDTFARKGSVLTEGQFFSGLNKDSVIPMSHELSSVLESAIRSGDLERVEVDGKIVYIKKGNLHEKA